MSNPYVLQTRGLVKKFRGFQAVDHVDLQIRQGDIHALIGPNGAGKTTVFNLLTKFLIPTRGQILYKGEDITSLKSAAIARRGVVRSFQISAVFPHMTALENIRVALQTFEGNSFSFWQSGARLNKLNERAMELLDAVGLTSFANTTTVELAYGRKRALELATTLAMEPEILLLDEPTQGMGSEDVDRVVELVRSAAKGRTVLMVEHNLSVVSKLCDRITVLAQGAVLTEGDYETVSADPRVREVYMGSDGSGERGATETNPASAEAAQ
ncbi:MAG TPA: ABC transporter ATP-binding protein [Marinobacter hydrocarbonoclasticus]|jgi:branched-chain amino acid transport system ATP-binding protein|uniref:ABC transporter ATP-binding protein n=1 Tax=Marinobacter metalliresistant TaxID=2961995 RepID=A0ABZ2VZV1_9GAMM|nr:MULTISPECIES: ABC transporter ATP-binding protein [Marinobacter]AKV97132.1 amino acid ABC transporter ATP-binding protein [Marinobacter sp. CP1]MBY6102399.1 ABC transporter ATP-binding protein [Marinobacter nauticus]HAX10019.1 ABC transporter ATP-binding protein [Marinobacter nauticus]HCL37302.1 ABC transporter ATP-binding protein [Marinobacter nauticus]|tara:strand:+ start:1991 stop:2797 length:807 start_codon:yes stop_codon:yes gene_type:complete